jgi:hypothetical protein
LFDKRTERVINNIEVIGMEREDVTSRIKSHLAEAGKALDENDSETAADSLAEAGYLLFEKNDGLTVNNDTSPLFEEFNGLSGRLDKKLRE